MTVSLYTVFILSKPWNTRPRTPNRVGKPFVNYCFMKHPITPICFFFRSPLLITDGHTAWRTPQTKQALNSNLTGPLKINSRNRERVHQAALQGLKNMNRRPRNRRIPTRSTKTCTPSRTPGTEQQDSSTTRLLKTPRKTGTFTPSRTPGTEEQDSYTNSRNRNVYSKLHK